MSSEILAGQLAAGMSGEEKKNETVPGTVPHFNTTWHRTSRGGGRRQVPFIIVELYKIKDQCPALDIMCAELPLF